MKGYSEDEVAEKTGYRGVGHMRQELERWNFPPWFIEGDSPPEPKPQEPTPAEQKARGSGPVAELPPASNAIPLFREILEALARANEDLKFRQDKRIVKRFVQSSMQTNPVFPSDDFSDEEWKDMAELHGFDPEAKHFSAPNVFSWSLGEGTPTPQAPLPALIAAYVLTDGEIESLLDALYPGEPPTEVVDRIRKRIEDKKGPRTEDGLKALAGQLAALVRGKDLTPGRAPVHIPRDDYNLSSRITEHREAGMRDEDIFERLRDIPHW